MLIAAEPTAGVILLLLLTLIGAVLLGLGTAIKNRQPVVAVTWLLLPVLLLGAAMLIPLFMRFVSVTPQMRSMSPMPVMQQIQFQASTNPAWTKLAILFLIVGGIIFLARKCTSCNWQSSGSWIKTLVIAVLVIAAVNALLRVQRERERVAVDAAQTVESSRRDTDAVRKAEVQQEQLAEAAEQRANELLKSRNMQEMWEKLNQPRIKLDGEEHGSTTMIRGGAEQVAHMSSPTDEKQSIAPAAEQTPESLASSLARLERMVDQVSAVADRVSDTGTLIGKAMVAINETMDSRSRVKDRIPEATAEKTVETVEEAEQVSVAATPLIAEVSPPPSKTLDIVFDEGRLNQYTTSFEKIKGILTGDGLWRGTTVRFVPQERRIIVKGDLEDDFAARLGGTLINTVGKHRTPIHLSDVATITANPALVVDASAGKAPGERPAWVDEAPKNVGNVRRQVIVAGDFATLEECNREMDLQLYLATFNRIREISNSGLEPLQDGGLAEVNSRPADSRALRAGEYAANQLNGCGIVGIDFIRREIAKQEFSETVERSFGPMKKLYTQVEFSPSIDQELLRRWDEFRRSERFADVGVGAGSVLGLIGLAFGLLRVDTWTKGYYSKRLFLGVPAAIIGVLAVLLGLVGG